MPTDHAVARRGAVHGLRPALRITALMAALLLSRGAGARAETALQIVSPLPGERVQQLQMVSVMVRSALPVATRTISLSVDGGVLQTLDTPAAWQDLKLQWPVGERKPGTYALRVSAVGAGGARLQSAPVKVVVEEAPWYPAPRERSYALLVGVGQYQDTGITSLSYSVADVKAVYRALTDPAAGAYPPENVVMLTDDSPEERKPTRSNILDLLKNWLGRAGQDADTVTFYFSGHGVEEEGKGYLVPRDARVGLLSDTGVDIARVNDILQQTGARVKLLVVDACHSAAGKSVRVKMPDAVANGLFLAGEGRATLASCKEDQQSWEWPEKGHSVFTYYLAEALQGKADANRDRRVSLDETFQYVHRRVTEWALDHRKQQVPRLKADVSGEVILAGMVPGKDPIRRPGLVVALAPAPPTPAPAAAALPQQAPAPTPAPAADPAPAPVAEPELPGLKLYVATNGDDRWSGRLDAPDAGRADGPFATLRRARDAVRDLKRAANGALDQPVNVVVRGGTYFQSEPLELGPEDSGTAECPVTWAAYPGETPVVSGGRRITGWRRAEVDGKQIWAAAVPEVKDGRSYFQQLWIDGERRTRARHPNLGYLAVAADPAQPGSYDQGQDSFRFGQGDLRAWPGMADAEVVIGTLWEDARIPVAGVDEAAGVLRLAKRTPLRVHQGAPYYVENLRAALDQPGEWFLDRQEGVLYYLPIPGEAMDRVEAIAPVLTQLVRIAGEPQAGLWVEHIHFRGLAFSHTEYRLPPDVTGPQQAAQRVPGAVHCTGAREVTFWRCAFRNLGTYAIDLTRGCSRNRILWCELSDLGAGGVRIGEAGVRGDAAERTFGNEVSDCVLHHGGRLFACAVAVHVLQSYDNLVTHNEIRDFAWNGVSVGWTWGYGASLAGGNQIRDNHIHHLGADTLGNPPLLQEVSAIYTLGVQPGTVIQGNLVHDISGRVAGGGIYLDEGSSQILIEGNVVCRANPSAVCVHYGRDNLFRHNTLLLSPAAQVVRARSDGERSLGFQGNIVYWTQGQPVGGRLDDLKCVFERNLYWSPSRSPGHFGGMTWEQWRARGMDAGSILADPLFSNLANGDYRVRAGSPALQLGIRVPDVSAAGPRSIPQVASQQ